MAFIFANFHKGTRPMKPKLTAEAAGGLSGESCLGMNLVVNSIMVEGYSCHLAQNRTSANTVSLATILTSSIKTPICGDRSISANSIVTEKDWNALEAVCEWKCLLPPTIGTRRRKTDHRNVAFLKKILPQLESDNTENGVSSLNALELLFSKKGGKRNAREY